MPGNAPAPGPRPAGNRTSRTFSDLRTTAGGGVTATERQPSVTVSYTQSNRGSLLRAVSPPHGTVHRCRRGHVTATATAISPRELDDLVRAHLPLVGHLVRELLTRLPSHISREDLVSAGMAALATAGKSFDPERGIPFGSFATVRIRGALLDELRSLDWASRSVRARARRIETAQQELTAALGRSPSKAELAEALGVGTDELTAVDDDVQRAVVLSLQGFAAGTAEDLVPERTPGPEELVLHRERIGYLHHAIEALPERLKLVVQAYFFEERPMAEIAAELGVTESRISQLRGEALAMLR